MNFLRPLPAPRNWRELTYHPLSELVQFGAGIDMPAMVEGMAEEGYDKSEPVVLYKGDEGKLQILDGRHKQTAALKADVVPTFALFVGKNPGKWVVRRKLNRQHLTTGERAMAAAVLAQPAANGEATVTQREAAKTLRVSRESVIQAGKVRVSGIAAVQKAVSSGALSVSVGAEIADLPRDEQAAALKKAIETPTSAKKLRQARETKPGKSGAVAFDFHTWTSAIGILVRQLDKLARSHGLVTDQGAVKISSEHQGILRLIAEAEDALKAWRKSLAKK